ncbi:hypothetical protein HJFPF1_01089 [Paramyrothecium foliicola]|nr:hypothetical protein HJFPF1_01089 [Paramyrothecium foliicola]
MRRGGTLDEDEDEDEDGLAPLLSETNGRVGSVASMMSKRCEWFVTSPQSKVGAGFIIARR